MGEKSETVVNYLRGKGNTTVKFVQYIYLSMSNIESP